MILVDNNLLSTFARVGQLGLLFQLFPKDILGVPYTVHNELMNGIRLGCTFLEPAAEMIQKGQFQIMRKECNEQQIHNVQ